MRLFLVNVTKRLFSLEEVFVVKISHGIRAFFVLSSCSFECYLPGYSVNQLVRSFSSVH